MLNYAPGLSASPPVLYKLVTGRRASPCLPERRCPSRQAAPGQLPPPNTLAHILQHRLAARIAPRTGGAKKMRTMIVAWAMHLPWPLGGPDPDPSNHYTYVLFVPPALVVGFALVGWLAPRIPAYAALSTRRRLPVFLGAGTVVGILLCVALAVMQNSVDRHRKVGKVASSAQNTAASIPVNEPTNPSAETRIRARRRQ